MIIDLMKNKTKHFTLATIAISLLFLVFFYINPDEKPIIFIFIPVLLLWIALYNVAKLILELFLPRVSKIQTVFVFVGVSLFILLFLLSGIGQLTLRDVILVSALASLAAFYFYRTWA